MGEVSGNWTPPLSLAEQAFAASQPKPETPAVAIQVVAPTNAELPGAAITLPITVGDMSGRGATSFDFDLLYNPAVLEPRTPMAVNANTLSSGLNVGANIITPGRLRVSGFGAQPLAGAGILVNLQFRTIGVAGTSSPLTWDPFVFNEGEPPSAMVNGRVDILAPTATPASISGYVLTQIGRAPKGATVTLSDLDGNTSTTTVNRWGQYGFTDVAPGQTYFVTVRAKGYSFTPPTAVVTAGLEAGDLNFTAFSGP